MAKGYYMMDLTVFVEAESPLEAYRRVHEKMDSVEEKTFSWESTNKWHDPGGERVELEEIRGTIRAVLAERVAADETK